MNEHLEYYETVALMAKHKIKACFETPREKQKRLKTKINTTTLCQKCHNNPVRV